MVNQKMAARRTGRQNRDGKRLLLSCLSRLLAEPHCIKPDRATRTVRDAVDPVLISHAVVEETLSDKAATGPRGSAPVSSSYQSDPHLPDHHLQPSEQVVDA